MKSSNESSDNHRSGAREGVEDMGPPFIRHSYRMIFKSSESPSLLMPYKIGSIMYELVQLVRTQLHTGDRLLKIIQKDMAITDDLACRVGFQVEC